MENRDINKPRRPDGEVVVVSRHCRMPLETSESAIVVEMGSFDNTDAGVVKDARKA
jgi:hypothetical protein